MHNMYNTCTITLMVSEDSILQISVTDYTMVSKSKPLWDHPGSKPGGSSFFLNYSAL